MSENSNNIHDEISMLTQKCNMQIDYIKKQESVIAEREKRIEELEEMQCKASEFVEVEDAVKGRGKRELIEKFTIFYEVIVEALKNNSFYSSRRNTEITRRFTTIENGIIKRYIEDKTNKYTARYIMEIWADMGLLFRDVDGSIKTNYTVDRKNVRIVRVNKETIALIKECMLRD